jgi:uncharacterized repeat protein (TIGR01451 family)
MKATSYLSVIITFFMISAMGADVSAMELDRYSEFKKDGVTYSKCAAAYPTGSLNTSQILLEKTVPKQVMVNRDYAYQIVVTNLQSNTLKNIVITDKLPPNFELVSSDPQAGISGDTAQWAVPELGPDRKVVINLVGKASSIGRISSCATVTWDDYICATTEIVNPGLEARVTAPASASLCNIIPLVYTATNTGSTTLTNVYIDGGKTSELEALDGTRGGYMKLGTLAPGESKQVKVNAKATSTGEFNTVIRAVSDQITSEQHGAVTMVTAPVLNVAVSAPSNIIQGRTVNYTVEVSNTGAGVAENVIINSPVPAGTKFVSASNGGRLTSGNVIAWPAVQIPSNNKATLTVSVRPVNTGSIRAQATAKGDCAKLASNSAVTAVEGVAAILLEVTDNPDPIEVGGSTTYTISVTNQGSAPDTNIRLECMIEDTQTYSTSSGATTGSHADGKVTFQPLAKLDAKQRATWTVTVRGAEASDTRFKVSMTSDQLGRPVEESEATKIY